ncbi:Hypothetical protein NTJ_14362 [Nesidiocoris tenuis]|uniref:Uncharacterized protein n=1 Tax=Nesidiocoris tenuis TaxID=355587 RepID=A0ABN7BAX3_9HEMI|nr:Hypothetical protein NTJ_14362 [Nesidiocoris tenuis]
MALPLLENISRKRMRNPTEDEASEFTPLSKRINNLHLNAFPLQKSLIPCIPKLETHKNLVAANERLSDDYNCARGVGDQAHALSVAAPMLNVGQQWASPGNYPADLPISYAPDLTPAENPYYYESNRLLFELYQQRIQRLPNQY